MSVIRYTNWEVSEAHVNLIKTHSPLNFRHLALRKKIPGVRGKRVTNKIKAGVWAKPLGQQPRMTFSKVQDTAHKTLIVFARGTTTGQSDGIPDYDLLRQKIIGMFHNRRGTELDGEVYSFVAVDDYDIDDDVDQDVDVYEITSVIREDREDEWVC